MGEPMSRAADRDAAPIQFRRVERDATTDDPIVRSMLRHGAELEPDPRFERRLRGMVLNNHVAAREGYRRPTPRRGMTPIGRGVLISSVLLAASVSSVGAFSQDALPDDLLYTVKLQIEGLRMAVAPPDMRDDLLALSLEERVQELGVAAEAGRWSAATEAAQRVASTEAELIAAGGLTPGVAARVQAHLAALDLVLEHAPPGAAAIVADRLDPARDALVAPAANSGNGDANGASTGSGSANGANGNGNANGPAASPDDQGSNASQDPVTTVGPAATPRPTPRASQAGRPSDPGAPGG